MGTRIDDLYTESEDEDHPHACGDKACENYYVGDGIGSSPRVWGQVQDEFAQQERRRIIPTRVGTSILYGYFRKVERDHPHACGDKSACFKLAKSVVGSSPRVWGQVTKGLTKWITTGIIPTRVGTSCACDIFPLFSKDHPHACGDKAVLTAMSSFSDGSSPRVWGQAVSADAVAGDERIIPTRVGTSIQPQIFRRSRRDHPHACGDKNPLYNKTVVKEGSSPRVWGQVYYRS